ncbi:ABC-2 type transport system ATP-binding protein [Oceanospirillum multiglobuliferum]|uniref:ABC transporter ATP-binding protein n=1 Tax=Oceanospirillum multiglobuliferum TaxID=64969 RepID=A0A1T4P5Q2_9GAMM|nr:ABC transporter ATP-binding protein [Oceanospirillum multiglobuliferum]OPX54852.1 ABC transporter ATP-binding protein [Oceanospirillum multiglobuliferum]SJZ86843.1 ABC-2 type transport system ATP-binding protein [Oceanospirillum multiglobuliferum]
MSPIQPELAIETQGLSKRFQNYFAVNQLDLQIQKGTIYGFLGPNGCGKSTTIRMLTGLLTPSAGSAKVLGYQLPEQADELRLKIGYMTQKFSLYDNLSVLENLDFVGQIYGLTRSARKARIAELAELYHLNDKIKVRAGALSGGQKQRLALAAATMHQPQLLFLDEPTSAVDPENRREFWERLFDLSDQGTTILVSTHYMDEAERCHALAILEQGQKRADGTPKQLIAQMHAAVFEVSGDNLRQLRNALMARESVISTAQIGERLRVLVSLDQPQPEVWLKAQVSTEHQVEQTRPSLEDVFVANTGAAYVQRHPL